MKLIFKKRIGIFNIYSNGRIYCDLDRIGKGKKREKKKITQETMLLKQEQYKSNVQRNNEKTRQNIEDIKNCFRRKK